MQRRIILVLAILASLPVILKSRESRVVSAPAAFSVVSSAAVLVRVSGDVRHAGVYRVGVNNVTMTAIEMAEPKRTIRRVISDSCSKHTVAQGDHLKLSFLKDETATVACGSMTAVDRMLLGIALDINAMSAADFERLPGIGPVIALRIVEYRQKNGEKMRYEDLQSVEGIGEKKYKSLARYF